MTQKIKIEITTNEFEVLKKAIQDFRKKHEVEQHLISPEVIHNLVTCDEILNYIKTKEE